MTKVALLVEFKAKPGKEQELATFLINEQPLIAAEPATAGWFVVRLDVQTFAIFHAFNEEAGLQSHLNGPIPAALMAIADNLLAEPPQIRHTDILAALLPA